MEYNKFKKIFNETIFEKSKVVLLRKIANYPGRYIGLFRPTKPKAKILQNLLQSHEIRFGDAFEEIIEQYLKENGFEILDNKFSNKNNDKLNVDQFFKKGNKIYFVEQKVRDDHDSTKKRGQIENFEKKLNVIIEKYEEKNINGFFYFIDPELKKNRKYYAEVLGKMSKDYGVKLHVCYGVDFFELIDLKHTWEEILSYLEEWKKDIPELPETNFDLDAESSFEEIKNLNPAYFRKLFTNDEIFTEIVLALFPKKKTLNLLLYYFEEKQKERIIYNTLYKLLLEKLK